VFLVVAMFCQLHLYGFPLSLEAESGSNLQACESG
jgi:hypothetical protein